MRLRPPRPYSHRGYWLGLASPPRGRLWGRHVQSSPGLVGDFRPPSQFQGIGPAWIPWTTLGYVEKVRPQFLSLRQLAPGRFFSGELLGN
jgi:hypothetical protein